MTVLIPRGAITAGSPTPDSIRSMGVPIVPADTMTSLLAWTVHLAADHR